MQRETVETGSFAARLKTGAGCARCESMQSPSSVTGFYDDYPATKCDYRTESAARDGWYVSVTSMTRWAHAVSVYRSVHGQHRNNSLPRTSNVPLHFIAFAWVHVRGRVCVCACVRVRACVLVPIVKERCSASHAKLAAGNEHRRLSRRSRHLKGLFL